MRRVLFLVLTVLMSANAFAHDLPHEHTHEYKHTSDEDPDVSTLNGELVKVGEQNQYRYSYKKFNISTNPVGIIIGSYGISASYSLGANIAVKVDLNYLDYLQDDYVGLEYGITAPIYFTKVYTGYYIEPGFNIQSVKIDGDSNTVYGPIVFLGKHWMWDSGLNIAAALGVARNFGAKLADNEDNDDVNKLFGSAYLRFGYAF